MSSPALTGTRYVPSGTRRGGGGRRSVAGMVRRGWPWLALPIVVAAGLAVGLLLLRPDAAQGPGPAGQAAATILFTMPAGPGGLTVRPGGNEMPAEGPSAIDVGPDGTIWIADAAPRIVGVARDGSVLTVLDLEGRVAGVADLDVGDREIVALDVSTSRVLLVDPVTGDVHRVATLPEAAGMGGGLSGVAFGPASEVLVELHGGTGIVRVVGFGDPALVEALEARPTAFGPLAIRYPIDRATPVRVSLAGHVIEVDVPEPGGVSLLGVSEWGIDLIVSEAGQAPDGTIVVTDTIRRYAPDGRLTGIAAMPEADIWVASPAALDLDGAVLVLVVHEHAVSVVRVPLLAPGLGSSRAATG